MAVFHNQRRRAAEHPVAEKQPVAGPGVLATVVVRDLSERVQQLGAHRKHSVGARRELHLQGDQSRGHGRAHGHVERTRYIKRATPKRVLIPQVRVGTVGTSPVQVALITTVDQVIGS